MIEEKIKTITEKIKAYKENHVGEKRNILFKEILIYIVDNFQNLTNLLRSTVIVNMFLEVKDLSRITTLSSVEIKRLFKSGESNLLHYHNLVVENVDKKDKILKILCNKILLACRLDLYGNGKFIDFYEQVSKYINELKENEENKILRIPKTRKTTIRGGLKKRKKEKRIGL